jgi:hypothetical protein
LLLHFVLEFREEESRYWCGFLFCADVLSFVHHSLTGGATGLQMIFDCLRFAIVGEFSIKNGWDKL